MDKTKKPKKTVGGNKNNKNNKKPSAKKNPLVGKTVWTLTIVETFDRGDPESTVSVHTSLGGAINSAKTEFMVHDLMEYWYDAKRELKEQFFYNDPAVLDGGCFIIDCVRISN